MSVSSNTLNSPLDSTGPLSMAAQKRLSQRTELQRRGEGSAEKQSAGSLGAITEDVARAQPDNASVCSAELAARRQSEKNRRMSRNLGVGGTFLRGDVGRKKFGFSREEFDHPSEGYYEGQFRFYLRNGHGTLVYQVTGDKYVGQFKNDVFHGRGTRDWLDGSRYEGEWRMGNKHGHGLYTSDIGLKYEGEWQDGKRHGYGRQDFDNGDVYAGNWLNGQLSGKGLYTFANGDRYEGYWKMGWYEGHGVLFFKDGGTEKRFYKDGQLIERSILKDDMERAEARKVASKHASEVASGHYFRTVQRRDEIHARQMPRLPKIVEPFKSDEPLSARLPGGATLASSRPLPLTAR